MNCFLSLRLSRVCVTRLRSPTHLGAVLRLVTRSYAIVVRTREWTIARGIEVTYSKIAKELRKEGEREDETRKRGRGTAVAVVVAAVVALWRFLCRRKGGKNICISLSLSLCRASCCLALVSVARGAATEGREREAAVKTSLASAHMHACMYCLPVYARFLSLSSLSFASSPSLAFHSSSLPLSPASPSRRRDLNLLSCFLLQMQ